jgi:predicted enzyme related to lactoylglutathione lyase
MDTAGMPQCPQGSGEHGIGWVELLANDRAASATFYREVFGWEVTEFQPGYMTWKAPGGGPQGGLRGNAPEGTPACVPYISVTDVAAAQAQVEAAGGKKLTEPESIGPAMIGHIADPAGTIYGLVTMPTTLPHVPAPFGDSPKPPEDTVCSLEMYGGKDFAMTKGFFEGQFGWGTLETMPQYMMFDPGASIGGVFQAHTPQSPSMAYIYAGDVKAKLNAIEAAGGKRMGDPMSMPGFGTFGYFTDPSGTPMGLIGP